MTAWCRFNISFLKYIRETTGLFTLIENTSFPYFKLEQFLKRQCEGRPLSTTQVEMLMALACFIDIQEYSGNISIEMFPPHIKKQFKTLIEKNYIQLNPYSIIRKTLIENEIDPTD